MKTLFTSLFVLLAVLSADLYAQGTIRGSIFDKENGDPLIGVTVSVDGTSTGTTTDIDGVFDLSLAAGNYSLTISYISYETVSLTEVQVTDGEVNLLDGIQMGTESETLDEVVITAEVVRTSEAALATIKRKSTNLLDGISAAKFKKIGDSNAAAAVKRVTGVSVEGGKYVYVRGLGDRYTKTMMNSVDIPGLDPDRNSLQIDIFPTNLLSNMIVYKSSLAELPADFTGGVINIETKDFPEEKTFDVSFGVSFNPNMHLNSDFLTYDGGSTDFLGMDDGTRALPTAATQQRIPSPISSNSPEEVGAFLRDFNPTLESKTVTSLPDYSLGISLGDQRTLKNGNKLGYILSANYKSSRAYYDDVVYGEYQRPLAAEQFELVEANTLTGRLSEENVLLAGLAGLAYKTKNTKHRLTFMHLQNGESKTGAFDIFNNSDAVGQSGFRAQSTNLEYSQRALTNVLLNGEYSLNHGEWNIDWRISPTISSLDDPDIRKTAFSATGSNDATFAAGAGGNPTRIWRYLDEVNVVGKIDVVKKYSLLSRDAKLKFGLGQVMKERDYSILSYDLQFFGTQPSWTGDPSQVLTDANLYPNGTLYFSSANSTPNANEYNSTVSNSSAYVSTEFNPTGSLKATLGLRAENYVQRHTGRDAIWAAGDEINGNNLDNDEVLNSLDLFPSANLIQAVGDKQNLRLSYARTIARPSFKELSFAQIIDPITNRIFNGALFQYDDWDGNLTETRINNFDLRWEQFMSGGQLISASVFYKQFADPIELVRIPTAQTSNEFQPRNVGDGEVYGVEVEVRKDLSFISAAMQKWSFSSNVTVAQSVIDMTTTEIESRENFAKVGEDVGTTRNMAGQAPYIINAGFTYSNPDKAFDAGLYYNVKGRTLAVVGGGLFPDVYAEPFQGLKFSLNKAFGPDQRTSVSFEVDNILNDVREEFYSGFQAADQFYSRFSPGMTVGLGVKYSLY